MSAIVFSDEVVPVSRQTFFVEVILPVPLARLFTYRVPHELGDSVREGCRVIVPFGQRKIYTAVVARVHQTPPTAYQAKYLFECLDDTPTVLPSQISLWEWMASYYACTVGEVMQAALPAGLKISSESRLQLNPDFDIEEHIATLSDKELGLLRALQNNESLNYEEAAKILAVKHIYHILKTLIAKKAIILFEQLKDKYKPKTQRFLRLNPHWFAEKATLQSLFEQLEKTPKQLNVLLQYLQLVPAHYKPETNEQGIAKKTLTEKNISQSSLQTLCKNGVFEEFEKQIPRFDFSETEDFEPVTLTPLQLQTEQKIIGLFEEKNIVLLRGITGSGKTEIYINLIQKILQTGQQVLFMLPEIALTAQMVLRLRKVFGEAMGIYHSRFSDNERVEVWREVLSGRCRLVIGVRSSVFLPFQDLGLIIVDEEHESSYKQQDPAPRYHARDVAMILAQKHHAKTLLGSATPSVEAYFQAQAGRWGLVELLERYGDAQLPKIRFANMREEKRLKTLRENFSGTLLSALAQMKENEQQAILFQNRRGYAPALSCADCAQSPKCPHCDVSLTYHLSEILLRCHYCGHSETPPRECPACGSPKLQTVGFGTEKLEEQLQLLMPNLRVQRIDQDTTRHKNSLQQIIEDFEQYRADVLVGTQMVSKGLDFERVSLVGIFDIDRMLNFPDFRAHERTFQMGVQVSGRAGRREKQGEVIIQTNNPDQSTLQQIANTDYLAMYANEIAERQQFGYPPFTRLIKCTVRHQDNDYAAAAARFMAEQLATQLGKSRVLGAEPPLIERLRNQYLWVIMLKLERDGINHSAVKKYLSELIFNLKNDKRYREADVVVDIDPL